MSFMVMQRMKPVIQQRNLPGSFNSPDESLLELEEQLWAGWMRKFTDKLAHLNMNVAVIHVKLIRPVGRLFFCELPLRRIFPFKHQL